MSALLDGHAIHFVAYQHGPSALAQSSLSRMACCALHAAETLNPRSTLTVHTNNPQLSIAPSCSRRAAIRTFRPPALFDGTPLSGWAPHESSCHGHGGEQLADAIRLAVLHRHGGAYFDLDMLLLRDLTELPQAAVTESAVGYLNNAALFFPRQHPCLASLMTELVSTSHSGKCKFGSLGPALLDRVFYDHAALSMRRTPRAAKEWPHQFGGPAPAPACQNVSVLPAHAFSPVLWNHAARLLNTDEGAALDAVARSLRDQWERQGTVGLHLWNRALGVGPTGPAPRSILDLIYRKCRL